jgi:hypothetical protein
MDGIWTVEKKMVLEDERTSKGLKHVLQERGLWDHSLSLKEAIILLSKQQDFDEQHEWLEEIVFEAGCAIDFYPNLPLRVQLHRNILGSCESLLPCK